MIQFSNTESPIISIVSGNEIVCNELQPSNTEFPISINPSVKTTVVKLVQYWKALSSIVSTSNGIVISFNDEQYANALWPMNSTFSGILIVSNNWELLNTYSPIIFNDSWSFIVFKEVDENAPFSISFTVSGKTKLFPFFPDGYLSNFFLSFEYNTPSIDEYFELSLSTSNAVKLINGIVISICSHSFPTRITFKFKRFLNTSKYFVSFDWIVISCKFVFELNANVFIDDTVFGIV